MKKQKSIQQALALASCSLLGVSAISGAVQAETDEQGDVGNWDIKTSVLLYAEADDRVQALEPVITATKAIDTDESISLKLTLDTLTGASASGAVPTDTVQTFTRPSGNGSYETAPGETPLDDTFHDTRVAFNASWEKPISDNMSMVLGGNVSTEYDYLSLGANVMFNRDFNQNNTTVSAGLSYASDQIDPVGGVPTPFAAMQVQGATQPRQGGDESRDIVDLLFGVTQVINKNSLFQVNYSFSQSDGYHTDPYKVLSVVGVDGRPLIEDVGTNLSQVLFENRPDSRTKHSVYGLYKLFHSDNVFTGSLRYANDDWGIDSITADMKYRWRTSGTSYLQPHVRLYHQTEADFYEPYLVDGDALPTYASADYRLGEMSGVTLGLFYGRDYVKRPWSVGLEYYLQTGDEPAGKFGELQNQELFPDVSAVMLRFSYDL